MSSSDGATGGTIEGARRQTDAAPYGILVVDGDAATREDLERILTADYRIFTASDAASGLEALERGDIALILAGERLSGDTGVAFLERAAESAPRAIRILLTEGEQLDSLTRAINEGYVYSALAKPLQPDGVRLVAKRALELYELAAENAQLAAQLARSNEALRAENVALRRDLERRYAFDRIVGTGAAMERVFEVMEKVAGTDAAVLITGERGTGRDLVARAIHYAGPRRERHFAVQNCGALPDTLLESELFGHRRGAFTGAHSDKKGLFEVAQGGTVFLDDVGETHPGMQVRLLRVLQDGEIRPLGASETQKVDVRVIAATQSDLRKEVENGRFREDLYYRLRVVEIELPPLRERGEDVPALAYSFLESINREQGREIKGFTNEAMDALVRCAWPGNVRELESEIERAALLAGEADAIGVEMLSEHIRDAPVRRALPGHLAVDDLPLNEAVDALKEQMILEAIEAMGSKTRAAEKLGIPRQSLQKMMKRLKLEPDKPAE